ncbi:DUF6119 family protein [Bittarella massiliensis (ex Durand et al. 2017)]|uniref:DUF6119 family protein n=1 Tax=Bittarella massiliensis (ex Durand et al. 2017) TaxID=1720313 RepID=UPI001AA0CED7|nr:TIGR04141 family sporadically distributed protein [Bittarella massiliensis (ex Durand et al. 2017)]
MGSINLYRIDEEKQGLFLQELAQKMELRDTIFLESENETGIVENFGLSLYLSRPGESKEISWNWVLEEFHEQSIEVSTAPKGIIIVEKDDGITYAVTFGHSYFLVDKFCDREFGFRFARKLPYQEIKTTTLTTPNSRRNKTVNTYINYSELEFDSGESFAKLKAKVKLEEGFTLYKPAIEIGSSIRFSTAEESLIEILKLIQHVEFVLVHSEDKYHIPVFARIKDTDKLQLLEGSLLTAVAENPTQVNISELDIIGVTEIFNHNDGEFQLSYKGQQKNVSSLSNAEIERFCDESGWDYSRTLLNISVISLYNGHPVVTKKVRDLIDYTDDGQKCLLSKGTWYQYNDDYLSYLRDSIAEIEVKYNPAFDFSREQHDNFINQKYEEEKNEPRYQGQDEAAIKKALKQKYYAERAYNLLREQENGFQNFDRVDVKIGGCNIEVMDLYKDGMMCAVKIGSASSKLCYAVDQSLTALKLYKKGNLPNVPKINTVVLWFVLETQTHIEDVDGRPQLNQLDMLMLKNRLDQWKKEVRLQGFTPMIYINYRLN